MSESSGRGTVMLTVPTGHNVANLLRTSFLPSLLDSGHPVVVVSPFARDERFLAEFANRSLIHEPLEPLPIGPLSHAIDSLLGDRFLSESRLVAVRLQLDRARMLNPYRGRRALTAAKSVVSALPVRRSTLFAIERRVVSTPACRRLFDRYRPAVLATATAGFFGAEIPLLAEATRRGVPRLGVDLGWDNLSSKFHTIRPVDGLTVWNEAMRAEAVRYHGLVPDRVEVTGSPQMDVYFGAQQTPSRDAFLRAIGAAPDAEVVTLATSPAQVYDGTPRIVTTLVDALEAGRFGSRGHLLVRVHPRDLLERYEAWSGRARVTVEKPMARVGRAGAPDAFDAVAPTLDERAHLAATLTHSGVIVNFASTTTIEACVFDTPVINIGFDPSPDLPLPLSIQRYFHYEHYRPMAESGAVRIARTPEQLVTEVAAYLADRSRDRAARRSILDRLYPLRDGRSAERVAAFVLRAARASERHAA